MQMYKLLFLAFIVAYITCFPVYSLERGLDFYINCSQSSDASINTCSVLNEPKTTITSVTTSDNKTFTVTGTALAVGQTIPADLLYNQCCKPVYLDRGTTSITIEKVEALVYDTDDLLNIKNHKPVLTIPLSEPNFSFKVTYPDNMHYVFVGLRISGSFSYTFPHGHISTFQYDDISTNSTVIRLWQDAKVVKTTIAGKTPAKSTHTATEKVIYKYDDPLHVLIIDINDPNLVCFKAHIGLKNKVGEKNGNGNLKKEYVLSRFSQLVTDHNAVLAGNSPKAAFNTDYVDNYQPLDTNIIQGYDYSGKRHWTSMAISKNNQISFSTTKPLNAYNVTGGGPHLYEKGTFLNLSQDILGRALSDPRRTVVGITNNHYMIVIVSSNLYYDQIPITLNKYAQLVGGHITDANLFDGGGSPSLMYKSNSKNPLTGNNPSFLTRLWETLIGSKATNPDFKQEGHNNLGAALLVFEGKACQKR